MSEQLYRIIDFDNLDDTGKSTEPVQFVGVYTLRWNRERHPTVGFVEAEETIYTEKLREYLDETIEYWRNQKEFDAIKAAIIIDAYQSVRTSMLGETLPE